MAQANNAAHAVAGPADARNLPERIDMTTLIRYRGTNPCGMPQAARPGLGRAGGSGFPIGRGFRLCALLPVCYKDRKSTRLNSSHVKISYAVFCLKKKKATNGDRAACGEL